MREIEFRGKHKNPYGDKWIEGYYALLDGEHVIIMPHSTSYEVLRENKPIPTISVEHEIDINTLGEYTGLKDKNGKKIFEGDIVDITRPCIYEQGIVIFKNGCFFIKSKETLLALYQCEVNNYKLKVIGNIYDNSELLEVQDEYEM